MVVLADQQLFDVSNHANGSIGWELALFIPQSSNESDEVANSLF
jgi:hypothetical protein